MNALLGAPATEFGVPKRCDWPAGSLARIVVVGRILGNAFVHTNVDVQLGLREAACRVVRGAQQSCRIEVAATRGGHHAVGQAVERIALPQHFCRRELELLSGVGGGNVLRHAVHPEARDAGVLLHHHHVRHRRGGNSERRNDAEHAIEQRRELLRGFHALAATARGPHEVRARRPLQVSLLHQLLRRGGDDGEELVAVLEACLRIEAVEEGTVRMAGDGAMTRVRRSHRIAAQQRVVLRSRALQGAASRTDRTCGAADTLEKELGVPAGRQAQLKADAVGRRAARRAWRLAAIESVGAAVDHPIELAVVWRGVRRIGVRRGSVPHGGLDHARSRLRGSQADRCAGQGHASGLVDRRARCGSRRGIGCRVIVAASARSQPNSGQGR